MGKARTVGRFLNSKASVLSDVGMGITCVGIITLMLMITLNILLRYCFNKPLSFVEEFSGYIFIVIVFMGLAYTTKAEAHISVAIVTKQLRQSVRVGLGVITSLLALVVFYVFMWYACQFLIDNLHSGRISYGLQVPLWIPQIPICLGLSLFGLVLVVRVVKRCVDFQKALKGRHL